MSPPRILRAVLCRDRDCCVLWKLAPGVLSPERRNYVTTTLEVSRVPSNNTTAADQCGIGSPYVLALALSEAGFMPRYTFYTTPRTCRLNNSGLLEARGRRSSLTKGNVSRGPSGKYGLLGSPSALQGKTTTVWGGERNNEEEIGEST